MTVDRHMGIAFGGSLAFHLLGVAIAILLLVWKGMEYAQPVAVAPPPPAVEKKLTLLLPDMEVVDKVPETPPEMGDPSTSDAVHLRDKRDDPTPANPAFQANRNSRASSSADPIEGEDSSLPSQDGKKHPFFETADRNPFSRSDLGLSSPGDFEIRIFPDTTRPEGREGDSFTVKGEIKGGAARDKFAAVDAAETPYAKYRSEVYDDLDKRFREIARKRKIPVGVLEIAYKIDSDGEVTDVRMLDKDPEPNLADAALTAVLASSPPRIPEDVLVSLEDGTFQVTFTFAMYPEE